MKNSMQDLNNHLFAQLERLNDESIGHNEMSQEIEKAKAMAQVGKVLSKNAEIVLKAEQLLSDGDIHKKPKMLLDKSPVGG